MQGRVWDTRIHRLSLPLHLGTCFPHPEEPLMLKVKRTLSPASYSISPWPESLLESILSNYLKDATPPSTHK
jgi:hypothetical protein